MFTLLQEYIKKFCKVFTEDLFDVKWPSFDDFKMPDLDGWFFSFGISFNPQTASEFQYI